MNISTFFLLMLSLAFPTFGQAQPYQQSKQVNSAITRKIEKGQYLSTKAAKANATLTKMENYKIHWQGKQLSIKLPEKTQYSKGIIRTEIPNAYREKHDFVSAKNGIFISKKDQAILNLTTCYNLDKTTVLQFSQPGTLSIEKINEKESIKSLLDKTLKNTSSHNIISQDDISILFIYKTRPSSPHHLSYWPSRTVLKKIMIKDDIAIQLSTDLCSYGQYVKQNNNAFKKTFNLIRFSGELN